MVSGPNDGDEIPNRKVSDDIMPFSSETADRTSSPTEPALGKAVDCVPPAFEGNASDIDMPIESELAVVAVGMNEARIESAKDPPDAPQETATDIPEHAKETNPVQTNHTFGDDGYDLGGLRLRRRMRFGGLALCIGVLLPYEVIDGRPQFIWDLTGELPGAGLFAMLVPLVMGLILVGSNAYIRRTSSLAFSGILTFLTGYVCLVLGNQATAWSELPMPESLIRSPTLSVLILACVAAGSCLTFELHTRRLGQGVLVSAFILSMLYLNLPSDGLVPLESIRETWRAFERSHDARVQLGYLLMLMLILWPVIIASLGLCWCIRPAQDGNPVISIAAIYAHPLILGMFVFRAIPTQNQGWENYTTLALLVITAASAALIASIVEISLRSLLSHLSARKRNRALTTWTRSFTLSLTAALIVIGCQVYMAIPPDKGVDWTLGPATTKANELYGEAIPAWIQARYWWATRASEASATAPLIRVNKAAETMLALASDVDQGVHEALQDLVDRSLDFKAAGRSWYRGVAALNEASRAAELPYYADPLVAIVPHEGDVVRHFAVRTYRIKKVTTYDVDGKDFATLRIETLKAVRYPNALLGFSRDHQRFAVVDVDRNHDFQNALLDMVQQDPPRCAEGHGGLDPLGLKICGDTLARVVSEEPDLEEAVLRLTERHELQHQIDGPNLIITHFAQKFAGHYPADFRRRVNREVSAYLSELTSDFVNPHLALVHVSSFALTSERGMLALVSQIILSAMTDEEIIDDDGHAIPTSITAAFDELSALSGQALRQRANTAYEKLYGNPIPSIARQR